MGCGGGGKRPFREPLPVVPSSGHTQAAARQAGPAHPALHAASRPKGWCNPPAAQNGPNAALGHAAGSPGAPAHIVRFRGHIGR